MVTAGQWTPKSSPDLQSVVWIHARMTDLDVGEVILHRVLPIRLPPPLSTRAAG